MKHLFITLFLITSITGFSQKNGSITGKVLDKGSQEILPFVSLQIVGTQKGGTTDENGNFRISEIPVGTYNILFSYIGYQNFTLFNVVINTGNESTFQIELEAQKNDLKALEVTAKKEMYCKHEVNPDFTANHLIDC